MPAGLKDAFKSPFDQRNPTSRFHDINSFTKSSSTNSIRNEYYQSNTPNNNNEYNHQYYFNQRLPDYQPYPPMNPLGELAPYNQNEKIPHQDPCVRNTLEQVNISNNKNNEIPHQQPPVDDNLDDQTVCNDLINKVLSNKYCRQILRKIFIDENETNPKQTPDNDNLNQAMFKHIIAYILGGILFLCLIELLLKLGALLK